MGRIFPGSLLGVVFEVVRSTGVLVGFEGVSWVERECRHVTEAEGRIVVSAASVAALGVVSAVGVQSKSEFAMEEPESQRGCEVESQKRGVFVVWPVSVAVSEGCRVVFGVGSVSVCRLEGAALVLVEVAEECTTGFAGGKRASLRCVKNFWRRPQQCSPPSRERWDQGHLR